MPELVRLYIRHVLIGFAVAALFCVMIVWMNVAGLNHLVLHTSMGWVAGLMLFVSNGVVFAGVQFAIAVMQLAEDDEGPKGGRRMPVRRAEMTPLRVEAAANAPRRPQR